ncbi:MAG: NADH-quinone oxidoreductase subunit L [Marivivens sp.]|uniref:NADH-quinone oxidoreductase subunit L n=1 Tax=Marivivens sp. TaxID=1978374 RepID=UPI00180D9091|nr:NADH-quinone oxidoreductase subunit L [Marivivens sp.]NVJ94034.1 NADH-quinone oxidoreductase subunit L [Marivivens sp.]
MEKFILLAPFVGSLIAGFGWRFIGEKGAQWLTTGILFLCAALSWVLFLNFDGQAYTIHLLDWINSGTLSTDWAIRIDRLTVIMLIVVNTVSSLVHLYSMGYMAHDENWGHHEHYKARFFAYLSFFTFAMLMLVTSDNLVQMFFGWEGVGVASYLLIGFYYKKPSANAAAMKAFVVNRVGDFGFALGIFGLYMLTDSIQFDVIFDNAPHLAETQLHFLWSDWNAANLLAFLLFVGAMGKSAQLILHTWLPDAMEGPTPVSALIHAATMVTAGVFLVCRMSPLFEYAPETKSFIMYLGAATAFFAATVGLVQNDIKRVIAYSTCSQLGYMFVAAGAGIYGAAMFHLFTHAFFKAMLFLGAGSVIHAMHHEQDMRNYGNLRKKIPFTFWAMMIGTLAITGVGIPLTYYGFAGFLSKDAIIESAYASGNGFAFWALVVAALFTSFYSWRLMFMTFYGKERGDHHAHEHAHESPLVMLVPLGVLAMGAIFAGMIWLKPFFGDHEKMTEFFGMPHHVAATDHAAPAAEHGATDAAHGEVAADASHAAMAAQHHGAERGAIYMSDASNEVLDAAHHSPVWVKVSPFIAMLIGFFTAWVMYIRKPHLPAQLAANQAPLYNFLLNKWYFDELYDFVFVQPAKAIGRFFWKRGDEQTIDGGINGLAMGIVPFLTKLAGRAQSGYVFTYAFAMVLGIAVILTWVTLTGGSH